MDRTHDLSLATLIVYKDVAKVKAIEGQPGRREFVFDRDIPAEVVVGFHSSDVARISTPSEVFKRAVHDRPDARQHSSPTGIHRVCARA